MKKIILAALLSIAVMATPVCASEPLMGGWQATEDTAVTEDVQAVFDKALEGLVGAKYEPVALLSTQVVAGTNYCFLCRVTPVVPDAVSSYAFVYIYEDLSGNAEILEVKDIELGLSGDTDTTEGSGYSDDDVNELSFTAYDYKTGVTGDDAFLVYTFPDIRLYLPMEWKGCFTVESDENGVAFYQKASNEKYLEEGLESGGFLFSLCASEDESFKELPAYKDLGFSENAGLHFYLMLPSDYPAYNDEEIRAEYDRMSGDIDLIAEKAKIMPSLSFYPGESTDPGMS